MKMKKLTAILSLVFILVAATACSGQAASA